MDFVVHIEGKEYPLLFSAKALEALEVKTGEPTIFWLTPDTPLTPQQIADLTPEAAAVIERELSKKFFLKANIRLLLDCGLAHLEVMPEFDLPTDQEKLTELVTEIMAAFAHAHGVDREEKKSEEEVKD